MRGGENDLLRTIPYGIAVDPHDNANYILQSSPHARHFQSLREKLSLDPFSTFSLSQRAVDSIQPIVYMPIVRFPNTNIYEEG